MKKGLVSIITPCYNEEKYLKRYFESIISQTYKNIELIFVNDGSTDKTEEIAKSYDEGLKSQGIDFKYIYEKNSGQACAINNALPNVQGEYLYWMDADDSIPESAIESLVRFLEENKSYNIVRGKMRFVQDGKEIGIGKPRSR